VVQSKKDSDGSGSHCSSGVTQCPAPSEEGEDTSGHGSGSGVAGTTWKDSWSRDDDASSSDGDAQVAANAALDTAVGEQLTSLRRNGTSQSAGSRGHPDECKPCAFYCFSLRGCRNGDACGYCHMFHESKLRQRREEWKKAQREKKRGSLSKDATEEANENPAADRSVSAGPKAPEPTAPRGRQQRAAPDAVMQSPSSVRPALTGSARRQSPDNDAGESRPAARIAYVAREQPQGCAKYAQKNGKKALRIPLTSPGSTDINRVAAPRVMGPGATGYMPLPSVPMRIQSQLEASSLPGASSQTPTNFFAYTPSSAVIRVGQSIKLWPPIELLAAGMVFAVSPNLPSGLGLDENVGVIHGSAQQSTDGTATFFVTAVKPGDVSMSIHISVVNIQVVSCQTEDQLASTLIPPYNMLPPDPGNAAMISFSSSGH